MKFCWYKSTKAPPVEKQYSKDLQKQVTRHLENYSMPIASTGQQHTLWSTVPDATAKSRHATCRNNKANILQKQVNAEQTFRKRLHTCWLSIRYTSRSECTFTWKSALTAYNVTAVCVLMANFLLNHLLHLLYWHEPISQTFSCGVNLRVRSTLLRVRKLIARTRSNLLQLFHYLITVHSHILA